MVTTLSGVVQNYGGLIAIRCFLGFCEGGLLPGIVRMINIDAETYAQRVLGPVSEHIVQAP